MADGSQDELQWQVYLKHLGEALRDKLGNTCYEAFMDFGLEYMREALKEFYIRLPETVDPYVLDCLKSALDVCTSLRLQPLDGPEPMKRNVRMAYVMTCVGAMENRTMSYGSTTYLSRWVSWKVWTLTVWAPTPWTGTLCNTHGRRT